MDSKRFETYHKELVTLIQAKSTTEGRVETSIDSLNFYCATSPSEFLNTLYEPSLCIIVQGSKTVGLGDEIFTYDAASYLLASVHIPARVSIQEASLHKPYLSIKITFSMEEIFEVMRGLDQDNTSLKLPTKPERGLCVSEMHIKLLDPVLRLVRLLDTPQDVPFMSTLIKKEILYFIMRDKGGNFIRQYVRDGSTIQRIVGVIAKIKNGFAEEIDIQSLAKSVGMSESSLYHNFKKVTTMSPLQFQKSLRLQEARRILSVQNTEASQVAFAVGYESPSQFSREYTRMFGLPPKADIKQLRAINTPALEEMGIEHI